MAVQLLRHRFSVEEYHQMARAGILTRDHRVELIEGEILQMTPIGRRHAATVDFLARALTLGCSGRAIVRVQGPVRLSPQSEPQPDLVLLKPRTDFYRTADAGPADVLLLVEVADTSLAYDRNVKLGLYARAGIPEVWLVDLEGARVEVYRTPTATGYGQVDRLARGARLAPTAFPDITLTVDEILG